MSATHSLYRRIVRRETHSSRSGLAVVLAVALIVVFAWVGTEIVLALLSRPALLVAPVDMFAATMGLVDAPAGIVASAGIAGAAIGVILIVVGVSPGRRARHVLDTQRAATVVDNEVVASALARCASRAGNVDPDRTTVQVSHRQAVVHLTPTSGTPLNRERVVQTVMGQLHSYGLQPPVRARIRVAEKAEVGA